MKAVFTTGLSIFMLAAVCAFPREAIAEEVNAAEAIEYLERVCNFDNNGWHSTFSIASNGLIQHYRKDMEYGDYRRVKFNLRDVFNANKYHYQSFECNSSDCIEITESDGVDVESKVSSKVGFDCRGESENHSRAFQDLIKHFGGGKKTRYD